MPGFLIDDHILASFTHKYAYSVNNNLASMVKKCFLALEELYHPEASFPVYLCKVLVHKICSHKCSQLFESSC